MANQAASPLPQPVKATHHSTLLSSMALEHVFVKTDWQASEFCDLCFTLEMSEWKATVCDVHCGVVL
jgi:hypothetical protein